ncbi:TPA: hypothetical protein ACKP1B_003356 [Serratia fonticola]
MKPVLCLVLLYLSAWPLNAQVVISLAQWPQSVQLLPSSITTADLSSISVNPGTNWSSMIVVWNSDMCVDAYCSGGYEASHFDRTPAGLNKCPVGWVPSVPLTESDRQTFVSWVQEYSNTSPSFPYSGGSRLVSHANFYAGFAGFACVTDTGQHISGVFRPASALIVDPPPPTNASVCSVNNQNLFIDFVSDSLNVAGKSLLSPLSITCTPGESQTYKLSLTGTNVVNGQLNFGNGVSAQISINNQPLYANGTWTVLSELSSGSVTVGAALVGTASGPGVTNASGVLVLEVM